MSFDTDIKLALHKLNMEPGRQARLIALQFIRGVTFKTPVDHGYLRSAWNASVNEIVFITTPGQSGVQTVPVDLPPFPRIEITNGLPYAAVVEFGAFPGLGPKTTEGVNPLTGAGIFSKQAPSGMMMLTLNEIQQYYKGE